MTLFHKALHPIKEHFSVHQKKRANFKGKPSVWSWKKILAVSTCFCGPPSLTVLSKQTLK